MWVPDTKYIFRVLKMDTQNNVKGGVFQIRK